MFFRHLFKKQEVQNKKDLCNTSRIGKYGIVRLEFLKQVRREFYTRLLFSAGLEEYLIDINDRAQERIWELTQRGTADQMA